MITINNLNLRNSYFFLLARFKKKIDRLKRKKIIKDSDNYNLRIGVAGWELSHNAAGRVITLAQLYQYAGYRQVSIVGCIIGNKKNKPSIWQPIADTDIPCVYFILQNNQIDKLLDEAIRFVIKNPLDLLHVSKPRLPNMVLAFLYKFIWQTKIIVDIDDEELAFSGLSHAFSIDEVLTLQLEKNRLPNTIKDAFWTKVSVGLFNCFDEVTVSNPALQQRYGGSIIPHVRNERFFQPSQHLKNKTKRKFSISLDDTVILFFGTPKAHKGLIETAKAIAQVDYSNFIYVIVGDFPDSELKRALKQIKNVRYCFLPDQPYNNAAKIVAMGDICVLLQQSNHAVSQYQLPAKLIDALAMGITVFAQPTQAISHLIADGCVIASDPKKLVAQLQNYLDNKEDFVALNQYQQEYFNKNLSMQAYLKTIEELVAEHQHIYTMISSQDSIVQFKQDITVLDFLQFCLKNMYKRH